MRGKYRRKKLRKKYQEQLQYWKRNPDKFMEEFYGIKLLWYQKLFIRECNKITN